MIVSYDSSSLFTCTRGPSSRVVVRRHEQPRQRLQLVHREVPLVLRPVVLVRPLELAQRLARGLGRQGVGRPRRVGVGGEGDHHLREVRGHVVPARITMRTQHEQPYIQYEYTSTPGLYYNILL